MATERTSKADKRSGRPGSLQRVLIDSGKTRWLDVGCGGNFEPGFHYADIFPAGLVDAKVRAQYYRIDILTASPSQLTRLGRFDLVRLQHVLEHFSFEDGQRVIINCARLLRNNGLILITVPDLRVHVDKYIRNEYRRWAEFRPWATERIPADAPASFYFSVFAHSLSFESHRWCYDAEGVRYQLAQSRRFVDIVELELSSPLASVPFTHNRPEEDVCVVAKQKRGTLRLAAPRVEERRR